MLNTVAQGFTQEAKTENDNLRYNNISDMKRNFKFATFLDVYFLSVLEGSEIMFFIV